MRAASVVVVVGLTEPGNPRHPQRPASQTPSLPDARPRSDRFRSGGRESKFLAAAALLMADCNAAMEETLVVAACDAGALSKPINKKLLSPTSADPST